MTTRELSCHLEEVGRPIVATGITKIEAGGRRVDADDLVALAMVLGTTPNRLLLPPAARPHVTTPLTAFIVETEQRAWAWADGAVPLNRDLGDTDEAGVRPTEHVTEVTTRFRRRSRPDTPREQLPGIEDHYPAVHAVVETVRQEASSTGLPAPTLLDLARIALFGQPGDEA